MSVRKTDLLDSLLEMEAYTSALTYQNIDLLTIRVHAIIFRYSSS